MNLRSAAADAVGAAVPCVHAPWSDHNITDSYCCCSAHTGTGQGGEDSGVENSRKERVIAVVFPGGVQTDVCGPTPLFKKQKNILCGVVEYTAITETNKCTATRDKQGQHASYLAVAVVVCNG